MGFLTRKSRTICLQIPCRTPSDSLVFPKLDRDGSPAYAVLCTPNIHLLQRSTGLPLLSFSIFEKLFRVLIEWELIHNSGALSPNPPLIPGIMFNTPKGPSWRQRIKIHFIPTPFTFPLILSVNWELRMTGRGNEFSTWEESSSRHLANSATSLHLPTRLILNSDEFRYWCWLGPNPSYLSPILAQVQVEWH